MSITRPIRIAVAAFAVSLAGAADAAEPLPPIEAKVRAAYPHVRQLSPDGLAQLQANATPLLILDSRSADEFAVSHLAGARHVDPGIWARTFASNFKGALSGQTIVIYCSVGVRSSKLAERIAEVAAEAGATAVYNLEGGAFRWHNEGRPLVNANGPTRQIHPYDSAWGRYIEDQATLATKPGSGQQNLAP